MSKESTQEVTSDRLGKNTTTLSANVWNDNDTTWVLSLFGTAVGTGILFLPSI